MTEEKRCRANENRAKWENATKHSIEIQDIIDQITDVETVSEVFVFNKRIFQKAHELKNMLVLMRDKYETEIKQLNEEFEAL